MVKQIWIFVKDGNVSHTYDEGDPDLESADFILGVYVSKDSVDLSVSDENGMFGSLAFE